MTPGRHKSQPSDASLTLNLHFYLLENEPVTFSDMVEAKRFSKSAIKSSQITLPIITNTGNRPMPHMIPIMDRCHI